MQCHCGHNQSGSCVEIVPIFHSLTHEEMDEVARIAQAVTFQRGDQIYAMGDHPDSLFVIHTGRVKVYRLSDTGKEQVLRVLGPGDFLGELSLFSHTPMSDFSEALEEGYYVRDCRRSPAGTDGEVPPDRLQDIGRAEQALGAN